jgi:outer membrane beta-barrel protein
LLKHLCFVFIAVILSAPPRVHAQDLEDGDSGSASVGAADKSNGADQIEELYDREESKEESRNAKVSTKTKPDKPVQTLSDLANLSPFSDIAVIQRRFLPKTNRFELSATGFSNLNNPFFSSLGVSLRAAYYLRESYALEGIAAFATSTSRQATDDLEKNREISTTNVVSSKGFYALAFKWNPIYGKMTLLNHNIVPFDMNFNAGFAMTQTSENESVPTLHLGTSQVFALSKSMAFRWDLIWNMYQATATDDSGNKEKLSQNDLFLGFGVSFYFPEATYR